jgi:methionine synthase II (cobalamin-independent)
MNSFQPNCHAVLIGSLPVDNHQKAADMVFLHTPKIPLWVQLPTFWQERMMLQFLPGMPGLVMDPETVYVDAAKDDFEERMLSFYEQFVAVSEGETDIDDSSFGLTPEIANGFFVFMERLKDTTRSPAAVKGQITGPVTITTGINDTQGRAIFYDDQLRDMAVKLLALKARWQARKLSAFGVPAILFLDEPGLAGFGSSAFISITREEILQCFEEVIGAIHSEGALAGIHVCANSDWSVVLDSPTDIISFDSYSYFDNFILYGKDVKSFFDQGKILACGIVPTMSPEDIQRETKETLRAKWEEQAKKMEALGIDQQRLMAQSLITPACGTGSLSFENAVKVLQLTSGLSEDLRSGIV